MAATTNEARTKRLSKATKRGAVAVEELLSIAAVMGCFVVPVSMAARTAGTRIAGDMDRTHQTLIDPKQGTAEASSSDALPRAPSLTEDEQPTQPREEPHP